MRLFKKDRSRQVEGDIILPVQDEINTIIVIMNNLGLLNTKKIGHTGTLDPLATGVLVLCIGNALKLVELLIISAILLLRIISWFISTTSTKFIESFTPEIDSPKKFAIALFKL